MEFQRATQWLLVEAETAYTKACSSMPGNCLFKGERLTLCQWSQPPLQMSIAQPLLIRHQQTTLSFLSFLLFFPLGIRLIVSDLFFCHFHFSFFRIRFFLVHFFFLFSFLMFFSIFPLNRSYRFLMVWFLCVCVCLFPFLFFFYVIRLPHFLSKLTSTNKSNNT